MRVVVDTNVIAYYLLGTESFVDEVKELWSLVSEPIAPSSWEAELTNLLWMSARAKVLTVGEALTRLEYALGLGIESVAVTGLWRGALARSVQKTVSAYDTLFVELADRERVPLATFDGGVLKAFPGIAKRPREITARKRGSSK